LPTGHATGHKTGHIREELGMAKFLFQGHGSYRFVSSEGVVIFVDPFAGEGYDKKADIILITHEHHDHNQISLITQNSGCRILRASDMLVEGSYQVVTIGNIRIEAVPAYNRNHDKSKCVGYRIQMDGIEIYGAGDTSTTDYMTETLSQEKIDYAILPTDGIFNMGTKEAIKCAEIIGALHTIPIHMMPGKLFSKRRAAKFVTPSSKIVVPGEEITL